MEQVVERDRNLQYIHEKLNGSKRIDLIASIRGGQEDGLYKIVIKRKSDGADIVLTTNLKDAYWLRFEDYYEEFTDYLTPDSTFFSLVDWFMNFVDVYLRGEYSEIFYKDKKTGKVEYRRLVFDDPKLGRRELISYSPANFTVKNLLGRYEKVVKSPRHNV